MTVLAVPATSVPSERVFSSSGRTSTSNRNRLAPLTMEMLQVVKFNHRNGVLDFSNIFTDNLPDLEAIVPEEMSDSKLVDDVHRAQTSD